MKLVFCRKCGGAIGFVDRTMYCSCRSVYGKYIDLDNVRWTETEEGAGIPFAIDNCSFFARYDKHGTAHQHNECYDKFYGKGQIQTWLFKNSESPGWETIEKISKEEYKKQFEDNSHTIRTGGARCG